MYELFLFTKDGIIRQLHHSIDLAQKAADYAQCKTFRCIYKSSLAKPKERKVKP